MDAAVGMHETVVGRVTHAGLKRAQPQPIAADAGQHMVGMAVGRRVAQIPHHTECRAFTHLPIIRVGEIAEDVGKALVQRTGLRKIVEIALAVVHGVGEFVAHDVQRRHALAELKGIARAAHILGIDAANAEVGLDIHLYLFAVIVV